MLTAPKAAADDRSFVHMAAIAGMASLPLAVGNLVTMFAAVHFDLNAIEHPAARRGSPSPAGDLRPAGNAGRGS
jgi:hypothetical protein